MKWILKSDQVPETIDELKAILLANRNVEDVTVFFSPVSPLELTLPEVGLDPKQMRKIMERLTQAREQKEDVLIFGDYDADGICATATLWQALKAFGIIARPFIPHREKHGYGLNERSLKAVLSEKKPDLLITVDNGVVAHTAFTQLKELGVDTILTDHHAPELDPETGAPIYPPVSAILHSTQLCGTTVAWFLARELSPDSARLSLDLTAIATVADQMSLLGVSRSFVKFGLETLRSTKRIGLQLLMAKSEINQETVTVNSINFGIGPRINAMGRLKHGMDALRLLCTQSLERAEELVDELNTTNTSRQELTTEMIAHALDRAHLWENESIIIIESAEYHEGVIGLIAGKLMETFYKPAIVIAVGDQVAKASARSIAGVNIIELIRLVKDDLLEAGGHPMAAGFALLPEKIDQVRQRLHVLAKNQITAELLTPSLEVECLLGHHLLSSECLQVIAEFEPFGQLNREPVFGLENLRVVQAVTIGRENKHLRLTVMSDDPDQGTQPITCIGWGMGAKVSSLSSFQSAKSRPGGAAPLPPNSLLSLAGTLELNKWKGRVSIQVMIKDLQFSESQTSAHE